MDKKQYHSPLATAAQDSAGSAELLAALKAAVRLIRTWHGMGMGPAEQQAWELYQASPEMRSINATIAKAEGREVSR